MNAAIVTARKGHKDKNVWTVGGKPLISYPINAAWLSTHVQDVWVTTDSEAVTEVAKDLGCNIIDRPAELATDEANHGDTIKHAVNLLPPEYKNVVVMLGNTVMVDAGLINKALVMMYDRPEIDSVMSVVDMADDHPLRVQTINKQGYLGQYQDRGPISTNRQDYPEAYLFDGGMWAFRRECVDERSITIKPWWWMGNICVPIVRPRGPCRDIHDDLEIELSEWWLRRKNGRV